MNPAHELRAQAIAEEIVKEYGHNVYLAVSSQVAPVQREISRANATVVQAYATQPARRHFP